MPIMNIFPLFGGYIYPSFVLCLSQLWRHCAADAGWEDIM